MDTTVVNGTVYYYVVSGVNSAGESAISAEVVARPNIAPVVTAAGGTNQVLLTWSDLAGATSYGVYRSDTDGGPYGLVADGIGSPTYVDTAVVGGHRYYYEVAGTLAGGVPGGFSTQVQAVTAPSDFTNAVAEVYATTVAKVAFRRADQIVATVQIERSSDGVNFTFWTNITANVGFALEVGLAPVTTKYYRLRASNVTGFSSYAVVSLTTPSGGYNVNFANATNGTPANNPAPTPPGHVQDIGEVFGDRGNGFSYGWDRDITVDSRYRQNANSPDLRYDTFNHLQKGSDVTWEMVIPNGLYTVRVAAGDPTAVDSVFIFTIEGTLTRSYVPVAGAWWGEFTNTVVVSDGRLTITTGPGAANDKINFVAIYPAVPTPNHIISNPESQTVHENRTVIFAVELGGGPEPMTFQWYHNGSPIPDSTNQTHVIQYAQIGDIGDYYVTVSNAGASTNSATATLTVLDDNDGPQIASVGSVDGNTIGVCFDEYVDFGSATDAFTYSVNDGGVEVSGAELRPDGRSVRLFLGLGAPVIGEFTVTAASVLDLAGNGDGITAFGTNTAMGLTVEDVGAPTVPGTNYTCDSDVVELTGGGADIWNAADQFYLASKSVNGDFDARVRVLDLQGSNTITKAALMVRESTAPGSRTLHLSVNPVPPGRDQFQPGIRSATDGTYVYWGTNYVPAGIPNCWLRITRSGDDFKGYRSTNGVDWILMAETNQVYGASVLVGLGVTAHDNATFAIGTFQGFSVGPISNPPTAPTLVGPSYSAGTFSFGIVTEAGRSYQVLYKDSLDAASWTPLTTVPGTGAVVPITDPGPLPTTRFYRVFAE